MKTFKAVFTKEALPLDETDNLKEYTFNSDKEVKVGDFFYTEEYKKHLQVVFVFLETYEYVNIRTGELDKNQKPFPYVKIKKIAVNESKAGSTTAD